MTDKESLGRAVEETKRDLYMEFMVSHNQGAGCVDFDDQLDALIAAVDARARAEERELIFGASDTERVKRLLENVPPGQLNGPAGNY